MTKAGVRPFTARSGCVYTFDGVDYDAEAAERMATNLDFVAGWTWRRIEPR